MNTVEYPLNIFHSPGVRSITVKGDKSQPFGVDVVDGNLLVDVQEDGDLSVEKVLNFTIHGTGHCVVNAEDMTFIGTGQTGPFVWHVFWWNDEDKRKSSKDKRLYTIFKYSVNPNGRGLIDIDERLRYIKVLDVQLQRGEMMAWILLEMDDTIGESVVDMYVDADGWKVESVHML